MKRITSNRSELLKFQKSVIVLFLLFYYNYSFSQPEMSAFTATGRGGASTTFVTDYQSIGINPSNLGWKLANDKMVSFGLLEIGVSVYSEALTKPELRASIMNFDSEDFTYEEKVNAAKEFTEAGFAINIDVLPIAFSVQPNEDVGGFAFGIRERFQWYSRLNETISEILFMGYRSDYFTQLILTTGDTILNSGNIPQDTAAMIDKGISLVPKLFSELIDDSRLSMSWYREFNLSYGRKIIDDDSYSLYGGIGLKYLRGIAIMEVRAENNELEAFSAISPSFGIDYGDSATTNNPSSDTTNRSGFIPKSVGKGFGIDIGFSIIVKEKLKIGFSINDMGSITWDGNVYVANDNLLSSLSSPGFNSYNLFQEAESIVGKDGVFQWSGETKRKTKLPTNLRVGASYKASDKFEVGVDMVIPVNDVAGNYEKGLFAFGVDFTPIPFIRLSTGITTGGNYGFNLPAGVTLNIAEGSWEVGVASRDIITFFTENRPTLSLSVGFLRFKF